MGTRHLVIVRLKGRVKVAQYGQWDGYPSGQGADIAKFLQSKQFDLVTFKKEVAKLEWISPKALKNTWIECGADANSDLVSFDIADKHKALYPELSRDTGAGILNLIAKGQVKLLHNMHDFLKDGLFCEWAYELDLDKKCVKVYRGGTKPWKRIEFKDFTVKAMAALEKERQQNQE